MQQLDVQININILFYSIISVLF